MNMTVLLKKCTYGLLLITSVIGCFCSSTYYGTVDVLSNGTLRVPTGSSTISYTIEPGHFLYFHGEFGSRMSCSISGTNISLSSTSVGVIAINTGASSTVMELSCNNTYTSYKNLERIDFDISSIYNCPTCQVCQECEECQECNECPTIDTNYCIENDLCPSCEGTGSCEEGDGNRSALYINDIQHPGSALINITIPEELQRNYTGDEEEMNIDVEGYGYDQEKMQQLVNTQYYTPTPEDMTSLVGKIADFLPLLAIMLLIVRTWYLIKKVF